MLAASVAAPIQPKQPGPAPAGTAQATANAATSNTNADIEKMTAWLEEHGLEICNGKPWKGTGYRWELQACPFNPDHDRGEAWICIMPSGARAAGCRHNSCTWNWSDLRAKMEIDSPADGPTPNPLGEGGRPRVDVRNDALAAGWLRAELGRGQLAGIFRRDNLLVHTPRMGEEGYLPPADLGLIDAGPAQVRPITTVGIKSLIETRYDCWRTITVRDGSESTPDIYRGAVSAAVCAVSM
jgi:hypothetical protein